MKYVLFTLLIFIIACDSDKDPVQTPSAPVIEKISIRETWNISSTVPNTIEVFCKDGDGLSDLAAVTFTVQRQTDNTQIYSDSLYDDAAWVHSGDGDVVAGDGVFTNRFSTGQFQSPAVEGNFLFTFTAYDKSGRSSQIESVEVMFGSNSAPQILTVAIPDTFFSGATNNQFMASVTDSNGLADISEVLFEVREEGSSNILAGDQLFDDGDLVAHGDQFAGDGNYAAQPQPSLAAGKQGAYEIRFTASDRFDESSRKWAAGTVYIENEGGQVTEVSVADTMHRPSGPNVFNRKLLTATVSDPQQLADVDSVYFFSLKPDSTLANGGNPILLVDNGKPFNINNPAEEAGDEQPGDGIYSFSLLVFSGTQPGVYRFSFYMRDAVGHLSPAVTDSITIF